MNQGQPNGEKRRNTSGGRERRGSRRVNCEIVQIIYLLSVVFIHLNANSVAFCLPSSSAPRSTSSPSYQNPTCIRSVNWLASCLSWTMVTSVGPRCQVVNHQPPALIASMRRLLPPSDPSINWAGLAEPSSLPTSVSKPDEIIPKNLIASFLRPSYGLAWRLRAACQDASLTPSEAPSPRRSMTSTSSRRHAAPCKTRPPSANAFQRSVGAERVCAHCRRWRARLRRKEVVAGPTLPDLPVSLPTPRKPPQMQLIQRRLIRRGSSSAAMHNAMPICPSLERKQETAVAAA